MSLIVTRRIRIQNQSRNRRPGIRICSSVSNDCQPSIHLTRESSAHSIYPGCRASLLLLSIRRFRPHPRNCLLHRARGPLLPHGPPLYRVRSAFLLASPARIIRAPGQLDACCLANALWILRCPP